MFRVLAAFPIGLTVVLALIMRVASFSPQGLLPHSIYNSVFTSHGATGLIAMLAFIGSLLVLNRDSSEVSSSVVVVGVCGAALCWATLITTGLAVWFTPEMTANHLSSRLVWSSGRLSRDLLAFAVVISLCRTVELRGAAVLSQKLLWLSLAGLVTLRLVPWGIPWAGLPNGLLLFVLSGTLFRRIVVTKGPIGWRVIGSAVSAGLMLNQLMVGFLWIMNVDVHLSDTYFVVGSFHGEAFIIMAALIALLHHREEAVKQRRPAKFPSIIGSVFLTLGAVTTTLAMLILGTRGMPRRYMRYLDEFQALHITVGLGALLFAAGLVISLYALSLSTRLPVARRAEVFE